MEIERKFLVDKKLWNLVEKPQPKELIQAYLLRKPFVFELRAIKVF